MMKNCFRVCAAAVLLTAASFGQSSTSNNPSPEQREQSDTAIRSQIQSLRSKVSQLQLSYTEVMAQAQNCDQNASNEDNLALAPPAWAGALHRLAALKFRNLASQNRDTARQFLAQIANLERQIDELNTQLSAR